MTTPDTPQAPAPALPALAAFPFPTALVVTGRSAAGDGVLLEAGDNDEIFPFASVTKPIVAWAALVAVDRGLLDLEAPAGPPAPDGATIENLLSHSSGIAADSDERLAAPGTRRIYSNRGIEILGERLEEATGTPLETWVETTVLEPLGMASVLIPGSPALAQRARTPVLPGLDGVLPGYGRQTPNPFGLGAEVRGAKSPHWTGTGNSEQTFGHFGQSGSFIWVDPVAERQAVFLGAKPFGAVHRRTWPELGDQILAL